jgi:hypothetical protein
MLSAELKHNLILNLSIGIPLFVIFGSMDTWFTLNGMQGNLSLEGSPIMRTMMTQFGLLPGLIIEKTLVLVTTLIIALITAHGIEKESPWVYLLAITPITKRWMRAKKRRFVAYLPLYLAALAQAAAAFTWLYLITTYGSRT